MGEGADKALTVVMYHYVRPIAGSRFERIRGLELAGFRTQLDHIERHHNVISAQQLLAAARGGRPLPDRPLLLTFDDGYADHAQHVFPELRRRGMSGLFFPAGKAVNEGVLLDVNKVHFLLASTDRHDDLVAYIEEEVDAARGELELADLHHYRQKFFKPNRFDSAQVIYIKRMLQTGLPEALRTRVASELFARYVSDDETAFARELYMSASDIGDMQAAGMAFGSHGYAHYWLDSLDAAAQGREIDASLDFLQACGVARDDFLFCYPYGAYNADTLAQLADRGCAAAFTTRVAHFAGDLDDLLEIPRLDTNDLPQA